jgi:hypothetical protein
MLFDIQWGPLNVITDNVIIRFLYQNYKYQATCGKYCLSNSLIAINTVISLFNKQLKNKIAPKIQKFEINLLTFMKLYWSLGTSRVFLNVLFWLHFI